MRAWFKLEKSAGKLKNLLKQTKYNTQEKKYFSRTERLSGLVKSTGKTGWVKQREKGQKRQKSP